VYIISVYLGPETKGKVMTAELEVIEAEVALGRAPYPARTV
jgi:MFS transporter, SHS family, lactate transporter